MYLRDVRTNIVIRNGVRWNYDQIKSSFPLNELLDDKWDELAIYSGGMSKISLKFPVRVKLRIGSTRNKLVDVISHSVLDQNDTGSSGFRLATLNIKEVYTSIDENYVFDDSSRSMTNLYLVTDKHNYTVTDPSVDLNTENLFSDFDTAVRHSQKFDSIYVISVEMGNKVMSAS